MAAALPPPPRRLRASLTRGASHPFGPFAPRARKCATGILPVDEKYSIFVFLRARCPLYICPLSKFGIGNVLQFRIPNSQLEEVCSRPLYLTSKSGHFIGHFSVVWGVM